MPIFMDRHDILGVTAKHVAEVHQKDLKVQGKFGCKTLTYWFDEKSGVAFCLVEAPEKQAVINMHNQAHGIIPHQIIEVERNLVKSFLGRITDPEANKKSGEPDLVINESAIRTILYIELKYPDDLNSKILKENSLFLPDVYSNLIHKTLQQHGSNKIKDTDDGFVASFTDEIDALQCAKELLANLKEINKRDTHQWINASIGLSTGAPVTDNTRFFGETIRLTKRLAYIAEPGQIMLSASIGELHNTGGLKSSNKNKLVKTLNYTEENFLNQLMELAEKCLDQPHYNVNDCCNQLGVSKSQLYRKTTALTGKTPNEFIKEFRLSKALKLMQKHRGNISEIAFETGFSTPSYFTQCFHKRYGILPSEYEASVA